MANEDIFLGAGTSLTFIPECDLYLGVGLADGGGTFNGSTETSVIQVSAGFAGNFKLVKNLYVGCTLERYKSDHSLLSSHKIKSNDEDSITIADTVTPNNNSDYFVINSYGAPVPAPFDGTAKRLLSDQWLGILESATFPTVEPELKQVNLSLGGSRNYTYQYKSITNFGNADLSIVANHGSWLYYFLGKCTTLECTIVDINSPSDRFTSDDTNQVLIEAVDESGTRQTAGAGKTINGFVETGPIFYRNVGNDVCPPIDEQKVLVLDDIFRLTRPNIVSGSINNPITYTFEEQNSDLLPSFAMEYNHSKLTGTNIYRTNSSSSVDEDLNFVQIARGLRVNTLTMSANENEEVKMSLSLNTRNVHQLDEDILYDARRGQADEKEFFNFDANSPISYPQEFREPFFFSDGTFKVLGETFLKINTLTLTMNNNLQDRRFLGVSSKEVQESIPAQRTYEISFTGHVTDNALYKALRNDTEDTTQTIELLFTKPSGETITLKFTDYFISSNNFPIADDKGPIVVEATVMPRNLSLCTVKTHWVLQG
tara:strand:+ start:292 stop:1914 length:1623 start_codon:yes stop_codon:yes gene_type:complete